MMGAVHDGTKGCLAYATERCDMRSVQTPMQCVIELRSLKN